eukprot:XP_008660717.2 uncharacterized protein LOC103639784 [Zea mays]
MVNKGKVISLPCHAIIHVVHPQRPLLRSRHTDKPIVPPYGTPPPPPYVMYPPGTVYAHPSTPPAMHPFGHYPMPTNGHAETHGAAPSAPEMNGKSEPGRTSAPSANGITSHSESEGSDDNSQNDSHSKDNDGKEDGDSQNSMSYSASQGVVNQTMAMLPMQPGAMVGGVPSSTAANLNIGVDYWAAPGSAAVPAAHGKAPAGSARGDKWDERELKKQKRKQSNRESARRSRLRKQIVNWLKHSPTEMEGYICPGCLVLSMYLLMPGIAWDELEENLLQRVNSLFQSSDLDFWRKGRFLVRTNSQLVSYKAGMTRLSKLWRTWNTPELTLVSPIAVVGGQKTSLILKGHNLSIPGTQIHCTSIGKYISKEVLCSAYPGTIYDDSGVETFDLPRKPDLIIGRCFVEVENRFRGNRFPVIGGLCTLCFFEEIIERSHSSIQSG